MIFCLRGKTMKLYYLEKKEQQAQAIVSPIGGQVTSYIKDGKEIIYLQRMIGAKLRGGIPICFPFFGPPKPRFAGEIAQHGWLRDQELDIWHKVIEITPPIQVIFQGAREKNRESYPWSLEYWVATYLTSIGSLDLTLRVRRLEDGIEADAPINPAFHPYFSNLGRRAVKIGEDEREVSVGQDETIPLRGEKAIIVDLGEKKVQMVLDGDFGEQSCLTLWTDSGQYFCVEPSLIHPDDFDAPKGRYLKQGQVLTLICRLYVLP